MKNEGARVQLKGRALFVAHTNPWVWLPALQKIKVINENFLKKSEYSTIFLCFKGINKYHVCI